MKVELDINIARVNKTFSKMKEKLI